MIYIKIDNDTFYDDAIVLVRSFYPRMEVKAYKQDTVATEADKVIDCLGVILQECAQARLHMLCLKMAKTSRL